MRLLSYPLLLIGVCWLTVSQGHAQSSDVRVVAISTGGFHSCALTSRGGIKCWGSNGGGELGDGTRTPSRTPVNVRGLTSGVAAVAAGTTYTCALTADGGVKCWGYNGFGQLGDGTTTDRLSPVDVVGLTSGVSAIAIENTHACALTSAAGVKCWGRNLNGELGNGTTTSSLAPVNVAGLTGGVAAIDVSANHACALTSGGAVKCWGGNSRGQLGDGTTINRLTPVDVIGLQDGLTAVSTGFQHTCVLTTSGAVKCWGDNLYGQLTDITVTRRLTPVNIAGLTSGVTAIAAGGSHNCALITSGGVKCWGYAMNGEMGDGISTTARYEPVNVTGLSAGVIAIDASGHNCALTSTAVKCWGRLHDFSSYDALTPVEITGFSSNAPAVAVGSSHTCALTSSAGAKCWGSNSYGEIGDGSVTNRLTPVHVMGLTRDVLAVSAAVSHSCAVTYAGAVRCWGRNLYGQIGDGTTTNRSRPTQVNGLGSGVIAVAAGGFQTCALTIDSGLKCWGDNFFGQLGDGTRTDRSTPVDVYGLSTGVASMEVGGSHACAVTTAGGLKCWGNNLYGQLGDGTTTTRLFPVDVIGLTSGVVAVTAASDHTCAVTNAGVVKCWGFNGRGALGDGTTTNRLTPVNVVGLISAAGAASAGSDHSCALSINGAMQCWGDNVYGQLGDGTTIQRLTARFVTGLYPGSISIGAGSIHTCSITGDNVVQCWGNNSQGRLGDGTTTNRIVPVAVTEMSMLFTDDPLQAGVTTFKRAHIVELRARIDALRARFGLAAISWTDPSLNAGSTNVRGVHITEMRTALADAYSVGGWVPPAFSDSTLTAGSTTIRVLHIRELRDAIVALEAR